MVKDIRKPTYSEIYMYKSLFWLAIGLFVFCPILNNVALQIALYKSATNILYSFITLPLQIFKEIFSLLYMYAGYAVFAICVLYFGKKAKGVLLTSFAANPLSLLTYCVTLWLMGVSDGSIYAEAITNELANLLLKAALYFALIFVSKKKQSFMNIDTYSFSSSMKKHPYTVGFAVMAGAVAVVSIIIETVSNIAYYTNPRNYYQIPDTFAEVMQEIIVPYINFFVYAAIGFIIMVLVGLLAQRLKDSGKRKIRQINKERAESV